MHNRYHQTKFYLSCPSLVGSPEDIGYEVIFAGRSNSGKSSAINAITQQKKLAKVSRTPGCTQHLVFLQIDKERRIVDLPGYGYAKISAKTKKQLRRNIERYLQRRKCLKAAILVMDCRHPLTYYDQIILKWLRISNLKTHIILTKSDKLSKTLAHNAKIKVENALVEFPHITVQLFSSLNKIGISEVWQKLDGFFNYKNT